jgi:hypothetical protein
MISSFSTYQHTANFIQIDSKIDAESKRCYERSEYHSTIWCGRSDVLSTWDGLEGLMRSHCLMKNLTHPHERGENFHLRMNKAVFMNTKCWIPTTKEQWRLRVHVLMAHNYQTLVHQICIIMIPHIIHLSLTCGICSGRWKPSGI